MTRKAVIQSHLEVLMCEFLRCQDLLVEPNGAVPVRYRSAVYRLRVIRSDARPHVEVYAIVVDQVDADPGLFEALNNLNTRLSHARAFWVNRQVVLAAELYGASLDLDTLACVCDEIACVAHEQGPTLAAVFGGAVAVPAYSEEEEA